MRELLFILIPAGLVLLLISIKEVIRFANSEKIYEMPCSKGEGSFTITSEGRYGLWISGKRFIRTPVGEIGFDLINQQTGKTVPLTANLLRTSVSGFQEGRTELYLFDAEEGNYALSMNNKAGFRDRAGAFIVKTVIRKPVDYSLFSVQVRKHIPAYILVLCVLGIISGSAMMLSGIILPLVLK